MTPTVQILIGDALDKLKELPDESVQCVVTSPPYDDLRTYGGTVCWDFEGIAKQLFRVIKDGGMLCWNVNDSVLNGSETLNSFRQAIFLTDVAGFRMHDTMIWRKSNFANPESVRYHQVFEYVFTLSKGKARCFNPIKDKPNSTSGRIGCLGQNTFAKRDGKRSVRAQTYLTTELGMRGNVWDGNTRGQEEFCKHLEHPAMMPNWLARDLIRTYSNPGDVILDPFAGSGTTGRSALDLGRNAILIEINPEYLPLIEQRTQQPGFILK